ncbi:MAG: AraC family transcriptional regulator [Bacteroidetes bacterium]|nr:MAG: AraC family transcriptional regulator [Bacteroidota bacterium]
MTFSGRFLLGLIHFAGLQGADKTKLIDASSYSVTALMDETLMISADDFCNAIELAIEETGDPFFGLHAGEYMNLSSSGLIGQITQTSSTIKEALDYCCTFANLGCKAIPKIIVEEKDRFKLSLKPSHLWADPPREIVRHITDGIIAFTLREFHTLTHEQFYPLEVHFDFIRPENIREYERVYKCTLKFNQPETAIFFDKKHVNAPVITKDYRLLRILVAHAEEKVRELEGSKHFHTLVKSALINLMDPDFPTIEQVALNLNMSARTLQRRLRQEEYNFKEILEDTRKSFALSYIKNRELSVNEIADLLHYADGSTFIRSFKRWTGKTPRIYRQEMVA